MVKQAVNILVMVFQKLHIIVDRKTKKNRRTVIVTFPKASSVLPLSLRCPKVLPGDPPRLPSDRLSRRPSPLLPRWGQKKKKKHTHTKSNQSQTTHTTALMLKKKKRQTKIKSRKKTLLSHQNDYNTNTS